MINWLQTHYIELFGVLTGLIYVYLEIKENIWLWPVGILTSAFFIVVFFDSKFYADMGLQFYYLAISIYGLFIWIAKKDIDKSEIKIRNIRKKELIKYIIASILVYNVIYYILVKFTDSPLPAWDSFTTALSIVATFMLAHKIIEQWWVWVLVNIVSLGLYIYKELYLTAFLFIVYAVMAVVGYMEWKKSLVEEKAPITNN